MTFINLIPDDLGLQRLKSDNAQPGSARAVTPVDPYPTQQPGQAHPKPMVLRREEPEQRKRERRHGERRQQQLPVVLDTRTPHDRRGIGDRRDTGGRAQHRPTNRLNLFA